jgi:hypothetical protein
VAQPDELEQRPPDGHRKDGTPYWFRPAFEPGNDYRVGQGNDLAVKHGAWSPSVVEPLAVELIAAVRPSIEWWTPADEPAIHAWARTEVRIQRITEWLADRGSELDADGEALGAANMLTRLEKQAESLRSKLGLDPLSRARLGRDVAQGQASAAQAMAAAASAAAREAGLGDQVLDGEPGQEVER